MNNKKLVSVVLFIIGFIVTYFIMCYLIPGLRIKLAAEPMKYFIESIKHNFVFKTIMSLIVGLILAVIPRVLNKNK